LAVSTSSGLSPVSSSSGHGYSPSPEAGSGYSVVASAGYGAAIGVVSPGMPSSDAASSSHGGPHAGTMPNAGGAAGPTGSYSHAPTAQSSGLPAGTGPIAYAGGGYGIPRQFLFRGGTGEWRLFQSVGPALERSLHQNRFSAKRVAQPGYHEAS
ncbi:MAG: hypothetical protein V2B18_05480, partial [Pseudomonadota bacterium]